MEERKLPAYNTRKVYGNLLCTHKMYRMHWYSVQTDIRNIEHAMYGEMARAHICAHAMVYYTIIY